MDKENANPIVHGAVGSKRDASLSTPSPQRTSPLNGHRRVLNERRRRLRRCIGGLPPVAVDPARWDPYEPVPYVPPPNRYDTSIEDPWNELSGSDVGSDDEHHDVKTRQVRRLQVGQYVSYLDVAKGVYRCPFCTRRLGGTDFNCVLTHAENIGHTNPKVGRR
ncbi:hypothetical protein QYE76_022624 [Lolium multiflorum]|uniref:Uncharacterized protein n=1 Tax=Lolium multiflorum TaxID=4521 RepID=A0AAD8R9X1_LOLMU|nr:hypothetical protein QYE76_022624 [Lolium multiflorum]